MKRDQFTISDITGSEGVAKLAHYNAWLLDPKREAGTVYPGYPGAKKVKAKKEEQPEAAKIQRAKKVAKEVVVEAVAKKSRKGGASKIAMALELYKANAGLARINMIGLFIEQLDVSPSNAAVYYYNVQKKL